PAISNPGQEDCDSDGIGDVCETDTDGDGIPDDCETIDLEVDKEVSTSSARIGDVITFTITITNNGDFEATNVTVLDNLPSGYRYVSQSASTGVYNEISGAWRIPLIGVKKKQSVNISVEVMDVPDYLNEAELTDLDQDDTDDTNDSDTAGLEIVLPAIDCLTVYNEFSPNGDSVNDVFVIECIENYPDNKLEVYNRWGNLVYSKKGYRNDWDGTSNGRRTINKSNELPEGTYYYVITLNDQLKPIVGWLYLNR
ncbi:gliding motility-associated C-terminal domain-containing protein, partial [Gaetbulibacter sp. M235]|uniref:T9SS type B sorting domain-containing protein n=1 Tax=Gaetbulibacter sp. M235 TaxID=3126510 RepID=UPI00374F1378